MDYLSNSLDASAMTAAPKAKPRKMWGVYFKESGELLNVCGDEAVARNAAVSVLKPKFVRRVLVTATEEEV